MATISYADMVKSNYELLTILQRFAPNGAAQQLVTDTYNLMQADEVHPQHIGLQLAGALVDGLRHNNWPWGLPTTKIYAVSDIQPGWIALSDHADGTVEASNRQGVRIVWEVGTVESYTWDEVDEHKFTFRPVVPHQEPVIKVGPLTPDEAETVKALRDGTAGVVPISSHNVGNKVSSIKRV